MGKNVVVYCTDEVLTDLAYIRLEDDLGPSGIFARAVKREAKRIRRLRERNNHSPLTHPQADGATTSATPGATLRDSPSVPLPP